jgi:hypothetical protein
VSGDGFVFFLFIVNDDVIVAISVFVRGNCVLIVGGVLGIAE